MIQPDEWQPKGLAMNHQVIQRIERLKTNRCAKRAYYIIEQSRDAQSNLNIRHSDEQIKREPRLALERLTPRPEIIRCNKRVRRHGEKAVVELDRSLILEKVLPLGLEFPVFNRGEALVPHVWELGIHQTGIKTSMTKRL